MIPLAMVTILSQVGAPLLVGDFVWGPPWDTPLAISAIWGVRLIPPLAMGWVDTATVGAGARGTICGTLGKSPSTLPAGTHSSKPLVQIIVS